MDSSTSLTSGVGSAKSGGSNTPMFIDSNKGNIKEQYHFKEKLANGGFGVVYLAEHRTTKQLFAVKAIQKKKVKDYATFVNEINILKVLDHPHIIKLHEIWEWNDVCFLVLEYCKGGELFHFILDRKHLTEKEAALIMKQLLSALMYLHNNNISHRDIKPENFMLLEKGDPTCVKMIDFGLSKDFSGSATMSTMSGSPYYIAPEVFLQSYNSKIDIWSLGVVLYIMLSGKVPFPGNSELEIIGNVIKGDFHFNHEPFQRHSGQAKEFLLHLIQKDVNQRYTADQAFNDPWIQKQAELSEQPLSPQTFTDMTSSLDLAKARKCAVLYLSQRIGANNFVDLQRECLACDPQKTGSMQSQDLQSCLMKSNMQVLDRECAELISELDPANTGRINYEQFLTAIFMTQMFLKEYSLTLVLKNMDTENKGGITIKQMQHLLQVHQDFQFPENALGATLKAMLGADINQLDPECIIDTDQFVVSLRKEFENICERSISKGEVKLK